MIVTHRIYAYAIRFSTIEPTSSQHTETITILSWSVVFPEPQALPEHSSHRKAMYGLVKSYSCLNHQLSMQTFCFIQSYQQNCRSQAVLAGHALREKGGKSGGWGTHTSQSENWDMLESVSKKAPALRDAPNAASPITAQLHIHLRICRPEEHAALKLVLSVYQWSEHFFSLLSAVYTTCPSILLIYYFIFSLFPPWLPEFSYIQPLALFLVFFIFHLSPASYPNVSLLNTQHAHLKNCVLELSLGFFDKGWGVGSLMTHSFIFSTYKPVSDCCIIYARAQHTQSILHLDLTQSLLTLSNFLKAARYEENN